MSIITSIAKKRGRIIALALFILLGMTVSMGKVAHATIVATQPDSTGNLTFSGATAVGDGSITFTAPFTISGNPLAPFYFSYIYKSSGSSVGSDCPQIRVTDITTGYNFTENTTGEPFYTTGPDYCGTGGVYKLYTTSMVNSGGNTINAGDIITVYAQGFGTVDFLADSGGHSIAFSMASTQTEAENSLSGGYCSGVNTQICHFTPLDMSTTTGPTVDFSLQAYINPGDLGSITGIRVTLHNIDQNVLLFSALSPSDIVLVDQEATTSGEFNFATSTPIGDGNYRLEACLERTYFAGFIQNPFANVINNAPDCQSHQFIVGAATFIGTVSQNGYSILNSLTNGTTTATTTAEAGNCYFWFPSGFNIFKCGSFLFVPDGNYLASSVKSFRDGVLTRIPWGYITRAYAILSSTTTVALPTFTASFLTGTNRATATSSLTFDPGDMLTGGAALVTDTRDPFNGKNARDIFEPIVQVTIALGVIFTIIADLTGSHKHHAQPSENPKTKKLS